MIMSDTAQKYDDKIDESGLLGNQKVRILPWAYFNVFDKSIFAFVEPARCDRR